MNRIKNNKILSKHKIHIMKKTSGFLHVTIMNESVVFIQILMTNMTKNTIPPLKIK